MKKLTKPQATVAVVVAAVVAGGSIYAYTENKKAYEHEQRCLSIEGELIRLARERKEVNDQLSRLVINDNSDYALGVFMQNRARIAELAAKNETLVEQMVGANGWLPALVNECGQPRAVKLSKSYPDLFPTSP